MRLLSILSEVESTSARLKIQADSSGSLPVGHKPVKIKAIDFRLDFFLLNTPLYVQSSGRVVSPNPQLKYQKGRSPLEAREKLRQFIIENFLFGNDNAELDDGESFLDSGIIDSTGILEVVGFIEDEFDFEVMDEELVPDNFDSVDKLVAYIGRKMQTAS
jgi:acyl carrier protein